MRNYTENISSISFYAKAANSLSNDDIKLSERLFLPGSKLRGFEQGKIGPKDGNDYIGGNFLSSININSTLPQILPNSQNTDFVVFLDIANIWESITTLLLIVQINQKFFWYRN